MELTYADLLIQINQVDDHFVLEAPQHKEIATRAFSVMLQAVRTIPTNSQEKKADVERTGDVFEDLELEMANDTVSGNVALQQDMQDMVAVRLLTDLGEGIAGVEASSDEVVELAYWFNRRRHVLYAAATAEPESPAMELYRICALWSQQLLEEATD